MLPIYVTYAIFALLFGSLGLTLIRLIRGPTLSDRVVALDLLGTVFTATIVASIFLGGHIVYLDAVLVMSVFLFFGTTAFAKYLEKRLQDHD
ncbi:cation:proton antiporter [Phragmitibacter flavus]|uniref:Cation:proton antiporter n=1 Tax=Phragmitibacter flavus TaxID=2576071 RepID=A0A5R8KC50_9BACT|nr:monovalent cation/H+ antiporter complex subunit F [Phragmitibacter flavus]TLD69159.1 cation:proton antiporter [Phragmitibacter flavus]